jgi:hypothetical protein
MPHMLLFLCVSSVNFFKKNDFGKRKNVNSFVDGGSTILSCTSIFMYLSLENINMPFYIYFGIKI